MWRSGRGENGLAGSAERRLEVCVVQHVEHLRTELDVEALRNPPDVIILEHREVQVHNLRPDQLITAGIAEKIRAIDRSTRRKQAGGYGGWIRIGSALRGHRGWSEWRTEAAQVEVL